MNHSNELDKLLTALNRFQREVGPIKRNAKNEEYKSGYATLDAIWTHIRERLTAHGLSVVQLPGATGTGVRMSVETMIGHTSGQYVRHEGTFPIDYQGAQSAASGMTYLCRYALQAALGIPSSVDDDGNAAAGKGGAADDTEPFDPAKGYETGPGKPVEIRTPRNEEEWRAWFGALSKEDYAALVEARLSAPVKDLLWAQTFVFTGTNAGRFLGELDDDSLAGYEKQFCPRYLDKHIAAWRAWKDEQNAKAKPAPKAAGKRSRVETLAPDSEPEAEPVKLNSPPEACPLSTDFRDVVCPSGTNKGLTVAELTPTDVLRYEAEFLPKFAEKLNKEGADAMDPAALAFYMALKEYKAWREWSPAIPMEGNPVDVADHSPRPPTPTATTPAALKVAPATTGEVAARQAELKGRKDLPKRPGAATSPAKASETTAPIKTASEAPKPASANPHAAAGQEWRGYVIPIGKPQSEGGSKGLKLGDVPLEVAKNIKTQYLDKRQWDDASKLKEFDYALKAAVEACLANDGKPPEVPKPVLPHGPVADLYARLDGFAIDPEAEFLPKMIALKKLPKTCTKFEHITKAEAEGFLGTTDEDWNATITLFEGDIPWE